MADEIETEGDALKYGNRNNSEDRQRIRKVRALANEMVNVTKELEPDDEDKQEGEMPIMKADIDPETLVCFGDAVKALGGGKVGGYLVRYSTDETPDLTGEYFTAETDFGDAPGGDVYYHHGLDAKMGKRKLGKAEHRVDEFGVWAEAQLNLRDEYEKYIYTLAEKGKIGWSSGTAPHLVEREQKGKAVWIKSWPLGLDDTLTPTPAEPRNGVIALKSLIKQEDGSTLMDAPAGEPAVQDSKDADSATKTTKITGENIMEITEEKLTELLNTAAETGAEKALKSLPAVKSEVKVTTDAADQPFPLGEMLMAVKTAAYYPNQADVRLSPLAVKASGLSEGVPADGGYLLQPQVAGGILEKMHQSGQILSRVASDTLGPNSNSMVYNYVDETSRATGSRWGGVRGYWLAEAASKTASRPKFGQMTLKLKKVAALCYATDELLSDATALQSWISRTVPDELRFMVEDAYFQGDGVGKPLGILNAPSLVTVLRATAGANLAAADFGNLWARRWVGANDYVWLISSSCFPGLAAMTVGQFPVYLPANSVAGTPFGSIFGRPVIETEYNADYGTTGDIVLASLSQYQTINKGGMQSASSIHVQFLTDETVYRFVYRTDGQAAWHSALTPFNAGSTVSPFVALSSASV